MRSHIGIHHWFNFGVLLNVGAVRGVACWSVWAMLSVAVGSETTADTSLRLLVPEPVL